jgi:hypothetical protein
VAEQAPHLFAPLPDVGATVRALLGMQPDASPSAAPITELLGP